MKATTCATSTPQKLKDNSLHRQARFFVRNLVYNLAASTDAKTWVHREGPKDQGCGSILEPILFLYHRHRLHRSASVLGWGTGEDSRAKQGAGKRQCLIAF